MKLAWANPEAGRRFAAALASGTEVFAREASEILTLEGLNVEHRGAVVVVHPAHQSPPGIVVPMATTKEPK